MSDYRECRNRDNCGGWLENRVQLESGLCENCLQERDDLACNNELRPRLRAQLAAAEARANELNAMLEHCRDEATEMERMLRAEYAKAEARAERLARLLLEVDEVALKIVSAYGVCDCIDNNGDAYQSQALADELQAIRAALAEGEAG